ncbi:AAA family ATPase, partial [Streptococcus suis]
FLVTSSEAAAGKSTSSANIAVAFAQQGKKVLLIDSDLRKPTVNITFKVQNRVGLTNILMHQSSIEDAIQGTRLSENLTI